jgi:hypothetical protein
VPSDVVAAPRRDRPSPAVVAAVAAFAVVLLTAGLGFRFAPSPPPASVRPYNLDGGFQFHNNDAVWDPNFVPGFLAYPNASVGWSDPTGGPGAVDYLVGSATVPSTLPHLAVGPQAFNFQEVPRTQVYRSPAWGDYRSVAEGFNACAVNLGNVTVDPSQAVHPIYVGMPEAGVDWTVSWTIAWDGVTVLRGPAAGSVSVVATSVVPDPARPGGGVLLYTQLVLWSLGIPSPTSIPAAGATGDVASFPLPGLPTQGGPVVRSFEVDLSSYLARTMQQLGTNGSAALLSYVYVSVAGVNVHVRFNLTTLSLNGPTSLCDARSYTAGAGVQYASVGRVQPLSRPDGIHGPRPRGRPAQRRPRGTPRTRQARGTRCRSSRFQRPMMRCPSSR